MTDAVAAPRSCACSCGATVQPKRTFALGHYARVAQRGPGGIVKPSLERRLCACGCGKAVNTLYARYLKDHQPTGPGARVATRAAQATQEQAAFGAFIRTAAKTAGLHGHALAYVLNAAWRAEAGHETKPRTMAQLAGTLGISVEDLLNHAPRPSSELEQVMNRGLARAGLTMRAVTARTGITAQQVQRWISGQRRPTAANLEALAALLGEPGLVTLLSPYKPVGKVKTTCSSCGRERRVWPNQITDLCKTCAGRKTALARIERIRKRRGRAGLIELGQELHRHRKRWAEEHPEEAAAITRGAQEANRDRDRSDLQRARQRLGSLTLNPPGRFGLCRLCGQLMFAEQSDIDRAARERRPGYGNFHSRCATAWSRSTEMREWASHCRRRQDGTSPPPMPMPPRPADRISSEDELREAYAATVRYFRQRERSSRAARDDHGVPLSVAALARTLGLSPRALYHRVDRFIELLPDEVTATGRVRTWRDIFLTLNAAVTSIPENVSRVAHHPEENASRVAHP